VICPKLFRDDCRNRLGDITVLRGLPLCWDVITLMALGSIKFQGEPEVETMPKSHISWPEMDIQRKHQLWPMKSWVETRRSSIQPATEATLTQTPNTNRSLGDKQRLHLVTLMHELIQDVITVHQAPNLKPHSANMFPTTGIARLNWSLKVWPRSVLCEKEEVIPDGNLKINEARSTRYIHHLQY
jgi:hypothetical protein